MELTLKNQVAQNAGSAEPSKITKQFKVPADNFPDGIPVRNCEFYITRENEGYVLHVDILGKRRFWLFGKRVVIVCLDIDLNEYGLPSDADITDFSYSLYVDEAGLNFDLSRKRIGKEPKLQVYYPLRIAHKGKCKNINPSIR